MVSGIISESEIEAGLPESIRPYLPVQALPLPRSHQSVVDALWTAASKIAPVIRTPKRIVIILATSPFRLNIPNGTLTFTPSLGVVNACVENMVFLDVNNIYAYADFKIKVAIILEELAHILLNIGDEDLVKHVVAQLYDGVEYVGGQFRARP